MLVLLLALLAPRINETAWVRYELLRFGSQERCERAYTAACEHWAWTRSEGVYCADDPLWWDLSNDAWWRLSIWGRLVEAHRDPAVSRWRLGTLVEMLGEEAYYAGQLPDPVPAWRVGP